MDRLSFQRLPKSGQGDGEGPGAPREVPGQSEVGQPQVMPGLGVAREKKIEE